MNGDYESRINDVLFELIKIRLTIKSQEVGKKKFPYR